MRSLVLISVVVASAFVVIDVRRLGCYKGVDAEAKAAISLRGHSESSPAIWTCLFTTICSAMGNVKDHGNLGRGRGSYGRRPEGTKPCLGHRRRNSSFSSHVLNFELFIPEQGFRHGSVLQPVTTTTISSPPSIPNWRLGPTSSRKPSGSNKLKKADEMVKGCWRDATHASDGVLPPEIQVPPNGVYDQSPMAFMKISP
ncbi:hypothetical protein MLD38_019661 [Melastoma candidum]|uniref:Uncharacterized protein n=1 Tax=Melastoma candidum TaxID=119954 RepID=A0ACB9R602_9MYRT|nr:hypothetical protein MLD38_019661 [Melastoma candidum]